MNRAKKIKALQSPPGIGCVGILVLALVTAAPEAARGHGEWLIQIVEVTQRIKATTNNHAALYLERGELHRQHQEWDAAESDYARAAQLDPHLAAVDLCRAKLLEDSGRRAEAEALLDRVIYRDPANGDAFVGRARVRLKRDRRDLAMSDYQRGLDLHADLKPEFFLELARACSEEKQPGDALRVLDQGMARFGPRVPLQTLAMELELSRGNTGAALVRLDSIIGQSTRKESWLARRGEVLVIAGRPREAQQAFASALTAISLLPWRLQQAQPMRNLTAQIERALAAIRRAEPVDPINPGPEWKLILSP